MVEISDRPLIVSLVSAGNSSVKVGINLSITTLLLTVNIYDLFFVMPIVIICVSFRSLVFFSYYELLEFPSTNHVANKVVTRNED